jgi:GPI mannosyltransferase 3
MRRAVAALIGAVALIQIFLAVRFFGFLTGDDVEVLSQAFRRATGFDYQPWDVRNLFVPDFLVAPFVFVGGLRAAAIPFIALTALTIWLVYRLALQWSGDEIAAAVAALLFALHWIPLGFGSTVYPRTLATACIVGAALLVDRYPFPAGALIGIAFADRFSEIVFLLPLLIVARRRAWVLAGATTSIAITVGLYDWITWGTPFSSVIKFAHLTLVEPDFASRVKYQSPLWYLLNVVRWCAPTLLPLLYFARRSFRWSFIVIPLLALSVVQHKELRYLQAVIPFLAIAAGMGFAVLYQRRRAWAVALLVVSLLWDLHGLRYFAHKSMPAVMAARVLAADPSIKTVAGSQLWAYGGQLYFGPRIGLRELGTPPRDLDRMLPGADAAAVYESDLDHPEIVASLRAHGFAPWRTFRDGPARAVVVFRPSPGLRPPSPASGRGISSSFAPRSGEKVPRSGG